MASHIPQEQKQKHPIGAVVGKSEKSKHHPREQTNKFRVGNPRSRSGCIVCRIRHVKCDEKKPSCQRCLSTGRKCDGYAELLPKRTKKRVAAPIKHQPTILPMPYCPSVEIEGNSAERRSFHYIKAKNLTDLFGRCEFELWNIAVLRFSHSHSAIRQSLLALSAIYEVYELHANADGVFNSLQNPVYHALQQYNKVVVNLAQSIKESNYDPRVVLLSCLIFARIEMILNNTETANRHLNCGINILTDMNSAAEAKGQPRGTFVGDTDNIYISIYRSFLRLQYATSIELQILKGFGLIRGGPSKWYSTPPSVDVTGSRSILDLPQLIKIFSFMNQPMGGKTVFIDEEVMKATIPREAYSDGQLKIANLSEDKRGRSLSLIHCKIAALSVLSVQSIVSANSSDASNIHEEVVDCVEEIFVLEKGVQAPITLDVGIISYLFYTLLWCSDASIRERAWGLMRRAPEREGFWHRDHVIALLEGNERGKRIQEEKRIEAEKAFLPSNRRLSVRKEP